MCVGVEGEGCLPVIVVVAVESVVASASTGAGSIDRPFSAMGVIEFGVHAGRIKFLKKMKIELCMRDIDQPMLASDRGTTDQREIFMHPKSNRNRTRSRNARRRWEEVEGTYVLRSRRGLHLCPLGYRLMRRPRLQR